MPTERKNGLPTVLSFFDWSFFSASSVIFAGSFIINVLNYIFTLGMSRMLGVEEFGEVAALLSLYIVITVPAAAITMLMSREAASQGALGSGAVRDLFIFLRKHVFLGAILYWSAFLFLTPLFSKLLHIPYLPFLLFSALVPITLLSALQSGALQGIQEFFKLSVQGVLSALVKLGAAVALVLAGFSVPGVMIALVVASLAGWFYGEKMTRKVLALGKESATVVQDGRAMRTIFASILFTTLLLALLSNIDVLLAKHFLSAELAGQYGALSTVGKIIIYGVGAFVTVLLPLASRARAEGAGGERKLLALSLSTIAVASLTAWGIFSLFPEFIVSLLLGVRYLPVAEHLGMFSIAMGCMALSLALINYFVAVRNTSFLYVLGAGIILEIVLIALSHDSLGAIAQMVVAASVITLALLVGNYLFARKLRIFNFPL